MSTTNTCEDCHRPTAWIPATFNHVDANGTCVSCHNGTKVPGKPANHISTTDSCDSCHVTTAWTTVRMDHTQALGTCSACHNGTKATGKPATHIPTTGDCGDCHKTVAWLPATFNHANVTGACSTCHNGTKATGKSPTHFQTTIGCENCHRVTAWIPTTNYIHSSPAYPGTHARPLACLDCHTSNSQTVPYRYASYAPNCAACHAGDFKAGSHPKYESPTRVNYTVSELRDCTGSCHIYTNSSLTTIKERRSSHHRVSAGGFD